MYALYLEACVYAAVQLYPLSEPRLICYDMRNHELAWESWESQSLLSGRPYDNGVLINWTQLNKCRYVGTKR